MAKRACIAAGLLLFLGIIVLESVSRHCLGLGDPPLSLSDAEIDYLFAPNQDCGRFGNRVAYNNASMRSDHDIDMAPKPGQCRVLMVGDSVINGGVLTDQTELASTLLDAELRSRGVGEAYNVSAGSWGPMNYAAYFRKYGTFGATDLVLEVNSHDLWEDDPKVSAGRNVGKDVALPDHKPLLACWEGFDRYFMPRVRRWLGKAQVNTKVDVPRWEETLTLPSVQQNLDACAYLYSLPFKRKFLVVHRSQKEWRSGKVPLGEDAFVRQANAYGVKVLLLELDVEKDYRDNIHLNASGQHKLYDLLSFLGRTQDDVSCGVTTATGR